MVLDLKAPMRRMRDYTMALWETQGSCRSHESEPFMHNQLRMTGSVVKQRRGVQEALPLQEVSKGQRLLSLQHPPLTREVFKLRYGTKALSSSFLQHPSTNTPYIQKERPRSSSSTTSHYVPRPPPRARCVQPPALV